MLSLLVTLLVYLLAFGVIWWAMTSLISAFSLPPPVATVAQVFFVVVAVLVLFDLAFGGGGGYLPRVKL